MNDLLHCEHTKFFFFFAFILQFAVRSGECFKERTLGSFPDGFVV